jgi:hypothetical protein
LSIIHKDWDINEHITGRFHKDADTGLDLPIIGTTLQNGLNDIEPDGTFVPCEKGVEAFVGNVSTLKGMRGRRGSLHFTDTASTNKHRCKLLYKNGKGRSIKYIDDDSALPDVIDGKVKFVANNGISIEHTPTYNGVKIELVIDDPLTAPLEYTFSVKDYGQTYTDELINGSIVSTGEDGKKFTFHAPYAEDANGEIGQVYYVLLGKVDGYFRFKKVVDEAWFRQAVAPVRIDPSVTIEDGVAGGVIEDALMFGGASTLNYGVRNNMNCNDATGSGYQNWAIKTDLSGEDSSRTVILAKYIMFCDAVVGSSFAVKFWPILRAWVEGTKNGIAESGSICALAAKYTVTNWTSLNALGAGTDYDNTTPTADFNSPSSSGSYDIVCDNSIIQARLGIANEGDVIHRVGIDANAFRTLTSEGATKPQFYYEYTEGSVFNSAWARNSNQIIGASQ